MLDLALNQSVRVQPLEQLESVGIPDWNDAAVRDHLQQEKGPLFILTPQTTKLDRIATKSFRGAPAELTELVLSVANRFDPIVSGGSSSSYRPGICGRNRHRFRSGKEATDHHRL